MREETKVGPSRNPLLPSKLPPAVRNPLCQIANLRFAEEFLRQFEQQTDISEPDEATLLAISRKLIEEEASNARKWELLNRGWERRFSPELSEAERIALIAAKKNSLSRALNAKMPRDERGHEVPLARAKPKYWEMKLTSEKERVAASEAATRSAELAGRYYEEQLIPAAKRATQSIWPELWEGAVTEPWEVLRHMRTLLQAFWRANNEHARDWYIHRAREYYQRVFILPKTSTARKEWGQTYEEAKQACLLPGPQEERLRALEKLVNAFSLLNIESERILNEPPTQRGFEQALFKLQVRAKHPSKAPSICKNDQCPHPYFLKGKKTRDYCSLECFHESKRKRDLKFWHDNADRYRPTSDKTRSEKQ